METLGTVNHLVNSQVYLPKRKVNPKGIYNEYSTLPM